MPKKKKRQRVKAKDVAWKIKIRIPTAKGKLIEIPKTVYSRRQKHRNDDWRPFFIFKFVI